MTRITVKRIFNAPADLVFKAISDIENFPNTNPDIVKIEFLSDKKSGIGTRFRETRWMGNRSSVTDLEISEFVENDHVRFIADSHGTIWDSIFDVIPLEDKTELTLTMDAKAHKLLPKILNPLMKGLYRKGLEKHMDLLRTYCEK